ncbi:uncharacterized protein LOC117121123 [Anneissia japonica]|uniref:uncharacterized protein LOC117121123 n=1 Tax=Anneissia japonica TaxID=1529436 RepID=UPI0014255F50|nr:uncharacterized protein LOC117121123 [Anneissia japonica]
MSINMLSWASDNIQHGYYDYRRGCIDWSCNITTPTISPYDRNNTLTTPQPHCYDCLPGCCQNGNIYKADKTNKVLLDSFTVGFGVLEMLICMVTIGLSFSQLSCYVCCRCNCCPRAKTISQYQLAMTPNGNLMMLAVSKADHHVPTMEQNEQNQPMTVQIIPKKHIATQNQPVGAQSSPPFGTGEHFGTEEQQVHDAHQPVTLKAQEQPALVQIPGQVVMVGEQGQVQTQPQGKLMLIQNLGKPMMVQDQRQPRTANQDQGKSLF